jgi:hypothetical protein
MIRCSSAPFSVSPVSPVSSVLKAVCCLLVLVLGTAHVQAADPAPVQLNVANAGPRQVEETTERAIARDYAAAWRALALALDRNDPAALGDLLAGFARERYVNAVGAQRESGVHVRITSQQHNLNAVFYSTEGSALELHDTAQIEREVLDGNTVIGSENVTAHYVVVMTPTSDHWQVRILQSEP